MDSKSGSQPMNNFDGSTNFPTFPPTTPSTPEIVILRNSNLIVACVNHQSVPTLSHSYCVQAPLACKGLISYTSRWISLLVRSRCWTFSRDSGEIRGSSVDQPTDDGCWWVSVQSLISYRYPMGNTPPSYSLPRTRIYLRKVRTRQSLSLQKNA